MKIKIEVDENLDQEEIVIRCTELSKEIIQLQSVLKNAINEKANIVFYQDNTEFYISLDEILFFETEQANLVAHTKNAIYQVKYKLYELEEILPSNFFRVSKSTILNIQKIYSITRNLTTSSVVEFQNTHKTAYVSRLYFKDLREKINEKRR